MSGNLETVSRWYADRDTSLLDDDLTWSVLESFPAGGCYAGKADVLERFFPRLISHFEAFAAEPETFHEAGETVVAVGTYRGRTKEGEALASRFAHLWRVRDGRILGFEQIADTALFQAIIATRG